MGINVSNSCKGVKVKRTFCLLLVASVTSGIFAQRPAASKDTANNLQASLLGRAGPLTKEEIRNRRKVTLSDRTIKVSEFIMSGCGEGLEYMEFKSKSEFLPKEMIEVINRLRVKNKLFFDYIMYKDKNGEPRMAKPFIITIK